MPSIKIHDVCDTTPQQQRLRAGDGVQWRGSNTLPICTLKLPGGLFVNCPSPFNLNIVGTGAQPNPPLQVVPNPPNALISRYIFKLNGAGCLIDDPPPEIVIEANFQTKRKPKSKPKRK